MRSLLTAALVLVIGTSAFGESMGEREGWVVTKTSKSYPDLVEAVKTAITENGFGVVTEAGPTEVARQRGVEIPGNRVIGAFNNDFAVRILALSVPAMIEAPVRFYVTEDSDGGATLSYKTPSLVFAPYLDEGGDELQGIVVDLDTVFLNISSSATQ
ncbi:MAG: DUF302 domain-containing protein [Pseudomonadota bacterium]